LRGSSFRYGGSDSINSIAMIPSDQMSTFGPYSRCLTTSGAIQYGVPTIVARLFLVSVSLAQKPKSAASKKEEKKKREGKGFRVSHSQRRIQEGYSLGSTY